MAKSDQPHRRMAIGTVTRDKMDKTRRVEISRLVKHPRYGKYIRQRTVCYVHDEKNESSMGDTVEIVESRPLSKLKNWNLVRIVTKAPQSKTPQQARIEADAAAEESSTEESTPEQASENVN